MDVNVQQREEKPLLQRTDVKVRVAYEGATPKRQALRDQVAHALKQPVEHIIIRKVDTEFGHQAAIISASVYADAKAIEQFEPRHMKVRNALPVPEKKPKKKKGGKK
jgi:small subunit ribosomal protein S24e